MQVLHNSIDDLYELSCEHHVQEFAPLWVVCTKARVVHALAHPPIKKTRNPRSATSPDSSNKVHALTPKKLELPPKPQTLKLAQISEYSTRRCGPQAWQRSKSWLGQFKSRVLVGAAALSQNPHDADRSFPSSRNYTHHPGCNMGVMLNFSC